MSPVLKFAFWGCVVVLLSAVLQYTGYGKLQISKCFGVNGSLVDKKLHSQLRN